MTYLAVMPRCHKPKAVPRSAVVFYQRRARKFYKVKGMTAAEARAAISRGDIEPTWVDGKPMVGGKH